jgi:asparagine synthase (glutamine-hydrolysing)
MSIFAGVYALGADRTVPATLIEELRNAVSRYPGDTGRGTELIAPGIFIVKIDIGALGEPGKFSNSTLTAFVAGDPILQLDPSAAPMPRAESLGVIAHDLTAGKQDALRACRGTYCAVVYERSNHKLHLFVDKLGVRPLYCWILPECIVFATALRILEALSFRKIPDFQGIAETACFGYPLSDRTPYENIISLHAGEMARVDEAGILRQRYWRCDELAPSSCGTPLTERLYRVFMDAVRLRLRGQKVVAGFLSGGLDSRAVVAALKGAGAKVITANLSLPGSEDQVFGQLASEKLDVPCSFLNFRPLVEGDPYGKAAVCEWLESPEYLAMNPVRPRVVWGGDGGSLGLGHIYLNSDIVAASRTSDLQHATEKFMAYNRWGLHPKLLKPSVARAFVEMVSEGMRAELADLHPADAGRKFYLFLMLNDQRRHMFNHFENLDLARIEFEMPFFDSEFIAAVMREPIDPFLRHAFYLEWLKCFPQPILETPWQAYPGHVPCPLPVPDGLTRQWDGSSSAKQAGERREAALATARVLLHEPVFAEKYLNRTRIRLFILAMQWGKGDRSYLMHLPSVVYDYWCRTAA